MEYSEIMPAVWNNDIELVKHLLDEGLHPTDELLHIASQHGYLELTRLLIQVLGPGSLNSFDEIHRTPLTLAALGGHLDVMKVLLDAGANINAHDTEHTGETALAEVIQCVPEGNLHVVAFLLEAGADPTILGWMQLTACYRAEVRAMNNPDTESKEILELVRKYAGRFEPK
ncbi:hypothetical protein DB346_15175 [Verrucomicrobia bacterium LW23]|nr:hypothetical protein DB346_15175 [Verrucomicrobia bacterium LW23]